MTLQQLRYVVTVAEHESMSDAAKVLFLSQPSLSNAIKDLEKEVGISIFNRSNKGISVSQDGLEFLGYARQIIEQTSLLEEKYRGNITRKVKFSVSTQHYSFAVNTFIAITKEYGYEHYDFQLRETRTYEIIEDVYHRSSEIGILYMNDFNRRVLNKLLKEKEIVFHHLFQAKPHVFISKKNPLARKEKVTLEEIEEYPYVSFEQGNNNSFYFSEEIMSDSIHKKTIKVSDRATLFNLLVGVNAYTISTGIICKELNGGNIIAIPLEAKDIIEIGYIVCKDTTISKLGMIYIEKLKNIGDSLL